MRSRRSGKVPAAPLDDQEFSDLVSFVKFGVGLAVGAEKDRPGIDKGEVFVGGAVVLDEAVGFAFLG